MTFLRASHIADTSSRIVTLTLSTKNRFKFKTFARIYILIDNGVVFIPCSICRSTFHGILRYSLRMVAMRLSPAHIPTYHQLFSLIGNIRALDRFRMYVVGHRELSDGMAGIRHRLRLPGLQSLALQSGSDLDSRPVRQHTRRGRTSGEGTTEYCSFSTLSIAEPYASRGWLDRGRFHHRTCKL